MPRMPRAHLLSATLVLGLSVLLGGATSPPAPPAGGVDLNTEQQSVAAWRAQRLERLESDDGWLTLCGLFWLKDGDNTFGRAKANSLVLDNSSLADTAGSFILSHGAVRFIARPGSGVTHDGRAVSAIELHSDASGDPTMLASGSLRFYLIERAGNLGVRVRDLQNPRRRDFRGLEYFPVSSAWVVEARFERYEPVRHLKIMNILGMVDEAQSPGAVVFTKDGREWRLDTVLESAGDRELFIMFADATSGHETYGGGRFLYIPLPTGASARVDFNKAYNPPCALNDFATCPLPPAENRLRLRIDAGEMKYAGGTEHR